MQIFSAIRQNSTVPTTILTIAIAVTSFSLGCNQSSSHSDPSTVATSGITVDDDAASPAAGDERLKSTVPEVQADLSTFTLPKKWHLSPAETSLIGKVSIISLTTDNSEAASSMFAATQRLAKRLSIDPSTNSIRILSVTVSSPNEPVDVPTH